MPIFRGVEAAVRCKTLIIKRLCRHWLADAFKSSHELPADNMKVKWIIEKVILCVRGSEPTDDDNNTDNLTKER